MKAMDALLRARDAWHKAGRPGAETQLEFFPVYVFVKLTTEAERTRLRERGRKRRR